MEVLCLRQGTSLVLETIAIALFHQDAVREMRRIDHVHPYQKR